METIWKEVVPIMVSALLPKLVNLKPLPCFQFGAATGEINILVSEFVMCGEAAAQPGRHEPYRVGQQDGKPTDNLVEAGNQFPSAKGSGA